MATIFTYSEAITVPIHLEAKRLLSDSGIELIEICFKPGESLALHPNPVNVIFHVKSGKGKLMINNELSELVTGDSAFVEKDIQRGWENTGSENLILLVIKLS